MKHSIGEIDVSPSTISIILLITDDTGKTNEMGWYIKPGTFYHKGLDMELTDKEGAKRIFEKIGLYVARVLKKKSGIEKNI